MFLNTQYILEALLLYPLIICNKCPSVHPFPALRRWHRQRAECRVCLARLRLCVIAHKNGESSGLLQGAGRAGTLLFSGGRV